MTWIVSGEGDYWQTPTQRPEVVPLAPVLQFLLSLLFLDRCQGGEERAYLTWQCSMRPRFEWLSITYITFSFDTSASVKKNPVASYSVTKFIQCHFKHPLSLREIEQPLRKFTQCLFSTFSGILLRL